jgi:hypothetical protein
LKTNALRQAVEAERRVYAKGVATPLGGPLDLGEIPVRAAAVCRRRVIE